MEKKNIQKEKTRAKAHVAGTVGQVEELSLGSWTSTDKALVSH